MGIREELIDVLRIDDNGHSLLGLGDRDLRSVEARILLRHLVEADPESRRELADRDGHSAGTEVVALLDQMSDLLAAEQSLQLSLCRRIALLDLRAAGLRRILRMLLGGAGRAADTVASSPSAEKNDDIARIGVLTDHSLLRGSRNDRADLHALCDIVRMIDLLDIAGCKTDLVAVGTVAVGSTAAELLLRKLARKCLGLRAGRISSSGHAHRLIDIRSSGERVTDCTAEAGRSTTERLDFCRVVVGLIFKIDQPGLFLAVHIDRNNNRAGIDLVGLLLVLELALLLQLLRAEKGHVHERDIFVGAALVELVVVRKILLEGILDRLPVVAIAERDILQLREVGRVTAVVGPVCIEHADLGDRRITVLIICKIVLDEFKVLKCHRQVELCVELHQRTIFHVLEAFHRLDGIRLLIIFLQSLRLCLIRQTGIDRVDCVRLDLLHVVIRDRANDHVGCRGADSRILTLVKEADTLLCGVCPLVELSRKVLDGENLCVLLLRKLLLIDRIHRRLREDSPAGLLVDRVGDILDVVTVENADIFASLNVQVVADLMAKILRLARELRFLFHINSSNHLLVYPAFDRCKD